MTTAEPSLNESVVLALLAEQCAHGFAIARELQQDSDLGRILTVHRPLVYRALDRLVVAGLAEPLHTEPGDGGPRRTVYRPTRRGRAAVRKWLANPVAHVRSLRIEFLMKLRLLERSGLDPTALVTNQRAQLATTLEGLTDAEPPTDVVDLWRHHNATAARDFLEHLEERHPPD